MRWNSLVLRQNGQRWIYHAVWIYSLVTIFSGLPVQAQERIEYWRTHYEELLPTQDTRAMRAHEIFHRLLQAAGQRRGAVPRLLILKDDPWGISLPIALPDGGIILSKGVLELCYRDTVHGDDRLAFVLGHEIAHLLEDHFWHLKFFQALEAVRIQGGQESTSGTVMRGLTQLPAETIRRQELQADTHGILYATIADFNPQAIVSDDHAVNFFRDWISARHPSRLGHHPVTSSHPSPEQRAEVLRASLQRVVNQSIAFQVGLWFVYSGHHTRAIQAFQHFLEFFPGREVYHNLALSHHQLALQAFQLWKPQTPVLPFQLSLAIDPVTRANRIHLSASARRGREQSAAPDILFRQHLDQAIAFYEQTLEQDEVYFPAALNLANALIVRGLHTSTSGFNADFAEAEAKLLRVLAQKPNGPVLPQILNTLGVVLSYRERRDEAKTLLHQARTHAPAYAAPVFNLWHLAQRDHQTAEAQQYQDAYGQLVSQTAAAPRVHDTRIERVMHVGVGALTADIPADWGKPAPETLRLGKAHFTVAAYKNDVLTLAQDGEILMLMTRKGFQGASARGIKIGSRAREVLAQYGSPTRRLEMPYGHNWSYDAHRIAFQLRDDQVVSWLVF